MTSAYILIAAVLLLGGLIAALGDRLGTKVGKARLRLFNLRPRQTAVVITVLTGVLISTFTLGILFAFSKSLRQGVFELDDIKRERRKIEAELIDVKEELINAEEQKDDVSQQLQETKLEQAQVENRLQNLNEKFEEAQLKLRNISNQASLLKDEVKKLLSERQNLIQQKEQLDLQIDQLISQVNNKNQEINFQRNRIKDQESIIKARELRLQALEKEQEKLQVEVSKKDNLIISLDVAIDGKDRELQIKESRLGSLESQLGFLKQELAILEQYYQDYQELREQEIAIFKGQVLAFAVVRVLDPNAVIEAIDELLRQANRNAIQVSMPESEDFNQRVVKIARTQVEDISNQIRDGQSYVIRIISAENYVVGESEVRVFGDFALNKRIFLQGEEIASTSIDSIIMNEDDIQERLNLLLSLSQFRARRAGILGDVTIENDRLTTVFRFIEELKTLSFEEIKAIATETTYTAGPLRLRLVAFDNGEQVLSTGDVIEQ